MRLCYLAPACSAHVRKWTDYMAMSGHVVHVISLQNGELPNANVHVLESSASQYDSDVRKLAYLLKMTEVRRVIKEIDPDIVHAHRAPSYGLLAALACHRDYYLSVWGEDVYTFPKKSPLHNMLLRYVLKRATWLMSTSNVMAEEASKYTKRRFDITPFGVDMDLFSPAKRVRIEKDGRFVVGTIKALESRYGISTLLRGVATVREMRPDIPIHVRIAGRGTQEGELRNLADILGISDVVTWLGFIPQVEAAIEWANMDVGIVMSESESFGVSAVEAQASGIPVVYSDIPGLMEAADGGRQGICVPRGDTLALAEALIKLHDDSELAREIGLRGRTYVSDAYELGKCFGKIESIYRANLN